MTSELLAHFIRVLDIIIDTKFVIELGLGVRAISQSLINLMIIDGAYGDYPQYKNVYKPHGEFGVVDPYSVGTAMTTIR